MLVLSFVSLIISSGCDIAYVYEIESGTEDNTADSSNVSIKTEEGIDVSLYESARIFPGLVDTLIEERINTSLILDLSKKYIPAADLGVRQTPRPIYSTGLYAGAGELITITINDNTMGLTVIIGSHMDDLTSVYPYLRLPVVHTSKALFPGKNTIRNPLGGMIWIEKSGTLSGPGNYSIEIEGVYKSPDFIAGETNVDEWVRQLKATTVPWLELRGKHIAISMQRERILDMIDEDASLAIQLENTLNTWDYAIERLYYNFYALKTADPDSKKRAPDFPERIILDVQLLENLYVRNANYGIVVLNTSYIQGELTQNRTLKTGNSVGIFNAFSKNYTYRLLRNPWWSEVSVAVEAISLYRIAEKGFREEQLPLGNIFLQEGGSVSEQFPNALAYSGTDSSRWFTSEISTQFRPAYALLSISQIAKYKENDWAFIEDLNYKVKESARTIDNTNSTYFFEALCDYFREDFSPFFDHWGFTLTDDGREYASQYPLMNKSIWKYNPLAANPSENVTEYNNPRYPYRHNRKGWEVFSLDANLAPNTADTRVPERIIDGSKSTTWHSIYSTGMPALPYYLFIDMKEKKTIDGFFLVSGNTPYPMSKVIIETPEDENIGELFASEDTNWKTIMELDSVQLQSHLKSERFFEFPSRKNVRYLRIKLPEINSGVHAPENINNERIQELAEFGTFYYKH
jgi:hypothetical protein